MVIRAPRPAPRRMCAAFHPRRYVPYLEWLEDRLPPGATLDVLFFPTLAGLLLPEANLGEPAHTDGGTTTHSVLNAQSSVLGTPGAALPVPAVVLTAEVSQPRRDHTAPSASPTTGEVNLAQDPLGQLPDLVNSQPTPLAPQSDGHAHHPPSHATDHLYGPPAGTGDTPPREASLGGHAAAAPVPLPPRPDGGLLAAVQFQTGPQARGTSRSGPGTDVELVPAGYYWRYLDDGSDQGTDWQGYGFDDSAWTWGVAQLGYGDGDEATVVSYGPDPDNKYITTYFRTWFYVDDATQYQTLHSWLLRDDGAVMYLNGTEINRNNMPADGIDYRTLASTAVGGDDENAWYHSALPADLLLTGWNSLAVEIHQADPASSDISFDFDLVASKVVRFAVIGDYGQSGPPERAVADMVASWYPDFVVTTGDNNYPNGAAATIVPNIGQYYCDFIRNADTSVPAAQRCNSGHAANRFYPSPGNHDWGTPGMTPYRNYFVLPGNERYYEAPWGSVHLLAVDSDPAEPDGITSGSVQGQWLQGRLAASTARWKLVYFHHPAYSSGSTHGSTPNLQWPYQTWGASAVLAGHEHNYERIIRNGFPYFVNGLGGNPGRYGFGTPVQGSMARYSANWGAMYVEAASDYLYFAFWNVNYTYFDDYVLY